MIRNSLSYVSYKDRKAVAADLKTIYTATTQAQAEQNLMSFAQTWDHRYPTISKSWMHHWERLSTFFAFPDEIRRVIYTTNAIESINMTLRKVLKNHRAFPTDDAALKVVYLAILNISKKWTMPIQNWKPALNRFAIEFGARRQRSVSLSYLTLTLDTKLLTYSKISRYFSLSSPKRMYKSTSISAFSS
jgi:transposase-like protein